MGKRKRLEAYEKPVRYLRDMHKGDYVYDYRGDYCYVDIDPDYPDSYILRSWGTESWQNPTSVVYLPTLAVKRIMDKIQDLKKRYWEARMTNSIFENEINETLHEIMTLENDDDGSKETELWNKLENDYKTRLNAAKVLHLTR